MENLPPLRRKVFVEVLKIVFLFGTLGFILIFSVYLSNKSPGNIFVASAIFIMGLAISVYFSEKLSSRIAGPIKKMTGILKNRPSLDQKLKFPPPTSLEMQVLMVELTDLWKNLGDMYSANLRSLQAQKNELEAVLEAVAEGVVVLDESDKILHYNQKFSQILEANQQSLKGQPWNDVSLSSESYIELRNLVSKEDFLAGEFSATANAVLHTYRVQKRSIFNEDKKECGTIYTIW